jgi:hypothetical protein
MSGFWDNFRQGRNQARAARGLPPMGGAGQVEWADDNAGDGESEQPNAEELQAALEQREAELDEAKRLVGELKDYIEQQQDRVVELIAGNEPMAKVLRLPGVRTWLLQRFHPDKWPDADERQKELLNDAMKAITAAYAAIAKEFQSDD